MKKINISEKQMKIITIVVVALAFIASIRSDFAPPDAIATTDGRPTITPTPTPTPSGEPTPTPSSSSEELDTEPTPMEPEPEPPPHLATLFFPHSIEETDPNNARLGYTYDIMVNGEIVTEYQRDESIFFGLPNEYTAHHGVTTYRSNNFRDGASWGTVNIVEENLDIAWSIGIGSMGGWSGVGWNGQPAIVRWDEETRRLMNLYPDKKEKNGLVEVICVALDGYIRFLDLDDGTPTRDPISIRNPMKSSATVDPRGYPLLYFGEGVALNPPLGFHIYSLIDCQELFFHSGVDDFSYRFWRSFDSNALIDETTDTLVVPGENGILYTMKLNTVYDREAGTISVDPDIVRFRYRTSLHSELGNESSVTAFANYVFITDNSGFVQCIDLNTMTPVWIRDCTDDTDGPPMLDLEEDGSLSLYTACEVDKQGPGGRSYIRKLDAATGELLWEHSYTCLYDPDVAGGVLGGPIIGRGNLEGSVIYQVGKVTGGQGSGLLVRFDKMTGEIIWETYFTSYGWCSPVAIYTEDGRGYIVSFDASGNVFLVDGRTGAVVGRTSVGSNVEASPAVFGNRIVVGTRGARIFCIEIS